MLKKLTLFTAVFAMLVLLASPAYAMLRVLDPELSEELKAIAKDHTASSRNIDAAAITIDEAWLKEFFNVKVDVYMVEATVDRGHATEQKIQIPVRVDTKAILSESDLALLVKEDNALAPAEPVMRIMSLKDEHITEVPREGQSQPLAEDLALAEDTAASQTGGSTALFVGAAILAFAVLLGGLKAVRRRA